ncbi:transcriptional regulator [Rhizobium leguminosarum bv. trifolii WSM2297]|uniref:HTH-type transcriptional regulator TtuA n=1 Tax=Rhizobium leguminosarum bv. trifolii WSM2297 TaxID=754762 RepID=J0L4F4_RHILT|nr:LysR family transcriptional regulator [Rhizobium leguminosarum]EJC83253.1 transcriptional regulator [Rhizobium leguminosarum bv. trifolii WSM2297]EJC85154.1 transcriptional regulator [Rhizobium leguminosarum bv. trifolii WSM2297]
MRGSDYAELRAFAAVAEHGNFGRAAARLGMSASALSQTIRTLEERMGIRLLNRTTRSVAPSEAGQRLLTRLLPALADLDQAIADVTALRDKPAGPLRINAPRVAITHTLAPLIAPFNAAYPDIVIDIIVDDKLSDIVAGRFDAGIRLGEMVEKDMVSVKLGGDMRLVVIASPDYIARHGMPQTPRDLRDHACVASRWPTDGSLYHWEFERGDEKLDVAVSGPLITTDNDLMLRAVLDGVGIGYLFDYYVAEHLVAGRLVSMLDDWTPPFPGFHLYYPSRRQMPPPLRAFVDFVRGKSLRPPPETQSF